MYVCMYVCIYYHEQSAYVWGLLMTFLISSSVNCLWATLVIFYTSPKFMSLAYDKYLQHVFNITFHHQFSKTDHRAGKGEVTYTHKCIIVGKCAHIWASIGNPHAVPSKNILHHTILYVVFKVLNPTQIDWLTKSREVHWLFLYLPAKKNVPWFPASM